MKKAKQPVRLSPEAIPLLPRNLGDKVHAVAHPVAKVIDAGTALLGRPTNLQGCGGCFDRRWKWGSDARKWPPADEAAMI